MNHKFFQQIIYIFTFWVLLQGKSFKFISQYTQKCQYNSLYKKYKTLCDTLNSGNWNLGFVKLVVRWAEQDIWKIWKNGLYMEEEIRTDKILWSRHAAWKINQETFC